MKKMIVIGGGAAGMMTAALAADRYKVTLFEKNEKLGKKLFITGKGRCNLTNDSDEEEFLRNVVTNSKFLYSAIYAFNQSDVKAYFEKLGLKLKTERGNRVFPLSDKSSDVIKALEQELKRKKVEVHLNKKVDDIALNVIHKEGADSESDNPEDIEKKVFGVVVNSDKKIYNADVVVLATGGLSYPQTGSDGDGLKYMKGFGIDVTKLYPSLVPVRIKEDFCKEMMGLSLKNVKLTFSYMKKNKKKTIYSEQGEMLFTHFGISGPLVLSGSSFLHKFNDEEVMISLDLKPALTEEKLEERVRRDFEAFKDREVKNSMGELLPRAIIPFVIEKSNVNPDKKARMLTSDEIKRLVQTLKNFSMTYDGLMGFNEAIITSGGIAVKEIDPRTMEIKKIEGLRVAGEIIDCDALTGGFNLQIAWSTAYLASR